jgi:hypothetical protein
MDHASLDDFLARSPDVLARGPVALIFVEDPVELASTLRHHAGAGFRAIIVFVPPGIDLPGPGDAVPGVAGPDADAAVPVHRIGHDTCRPGAVIAAVNAVIAASPPTTWFYYGYNAEYLFFPFCERRNIRELIAFHAEERRDAMLCYVVDLYAPDLDHHPDAVSLDQAMLDRSGYYALARPDPVTGHPKERQLDFFGGLRWRFEEHVPKTRRRIDRIAIFRAQKGLRLRDDHTFNIEEYNTYACPWHNNMTAAVASFRTAKALKTNPGSRFEIATFAWHNSTRFEWHSQQLMNLGLMEPGQWF